MDSVTFVASLTFPSLVSYFWISATFFGRVQELQSGLCHGLGQVQDGHLPLGVVGLGGSADGTPGQRVKIVGHGGNL